MHRLGSEGSELDVMLMRPARPQAAVLLWLDVRGVRTAARRFAERLVARNIAVVAPNYLRITVGDGALTEADRDHLRGVRDALTLKAWRNDLDRVLTLIDGDPALRSLPLVCAGSCIGSGYALATLAERPERICGAVLLDPCEMSDRVGTPLSFASDVAAPITCVRARPVPAFAGRLAHLGIACEEVEVDAPHGFLWPDWTNGTYRKDAAQLALNVLVDALTDPPGR